MFRDQIFDVRHLPTKGKRKLSGHKETRRKQTFLRSIHDRKPHYDNFNHEFGHLEDDTIVVGKHNSAVISLVGRLSK